MQDSASNDGCISKSTAVAICVATYLRPKLLGELLDSLRALNINGLDVHLIIVDNDAAGSAQQVVEEQTQDFPFPVKYVVEPTRGIASVRNRLFAEAYALDVEFIASTDDDTTVDVEWLQELVQTAHAYQADAVGGQQLYWFDDDLPEYIRNCYNLNQVESTGTSIGRVSTGSALFRTSSVINIDGPFDTRFNFTGGEDGHLANVLSANGYVLASSAEALVYEYVHRSRANVSFLVGSSFKGGRGAGRRLFVEAPFSKAFLRYMAGSIVRLVTGTILTLWAVITNRSMILRHTRTVAYGLGGLVGPFYRGQQYEKYRIKHGE